MAQRNESPQTRHTSSPHYGSFLPNQFSPSSQCALKSTKLLTSMTSTDSQSSYAAEDIYSDAGQSPRRRRRIFTTSSQLKTRVPAPRSSSRPPSPCESLASYDTHLSEHSSQNSRQVTPRNIPDSKNFNPANPIFLFVVVVVVVAFATTGDRTCKGLCVCARICRIALFLLTKVLTTLLEAAAADIQLTEREWSHGLLGALTMSISSSPEHSPLSFAQAISGDGATRSRAGCVGTTQHNNGTANEHSRSRKKKTVVVCYSRICCA